MKRPVVYEEQARAFGEVPPKYLTVVTHVAYEQWWDLCLIFGFSDWIKVWGIREGFWEDEEGEGFWTIMKWKLHLWFHSVG